MTGVLYLVFDTFFRNSNRLYINIIFRNVLYHFVGHLPLFFLTMYIGNSIRHFFTLIFLFVTSVAFAQKAGSVSGKVADAKGGNIAFATVSLLRPDSSVVGGSITTDDGKFTVTPVSPGKYILRVEFLGYRSKFQLVELTPDKNEIAVGTVKLTATETTLNTVTIAGEKKVMELKVDKKVFNVEKNITSAGGSATDVLQNVPSVSVDADGALSLRGKGNVTVLIDGKPATLMGTDVTSALQSLPASSIESVEVITNPSARYDAQGTTGIINIITKKDTRGGINGTATVGAGTRDKYNGNLGLNMRKGKWNVFLNSSYRVNRTFNNITTHRQDVGVDGNSYYTYEHAPRIFGGSFNSIGATYDIDKSNSITVTQNINTMQWGFRDWSDYYVYSDPGETGTNIMHRSRFTESFGGPLSSSTAFDYKHKFKKKGEEINVDATYAITQVTRKQDYETVIDSNGKVYPAVISRAPGSGGNSSLNVWADYVNPITETGKLGVGFKSQIFNFNSSNTPEIWTATDTNNKLVDYTQYTVYDYRQQIHAAYVNWSDQKGKISYQAGLRIEDAKYNGTGEVPTKTTFKNSFLNLFPSAFVSWQLTSSQSVYVNYSRRTNRPGFFQMMPFKDFSNPGTVSMGNPDILPEFIDNLEFSYNRNTPKGNTWIMSAYFARTNNLSERVLKPITGDALDQQLGLTGDIGQLLSRPMNIASGTTFGIEGTARLQFTKIWDGSISANFFNNQLTVGNIDPGYSAYIANNSGYGWFSKVNSSVKLPANFSLQFNGNYESPKVITQGKQRESYWLDVAVRKNLWKNKANLVINCSDVFKTRQFINNYNTTLYYQTINRVKETRIGNITFTYRFGKQEGGKPGGVGEKGRGGKRGEGKRTDAPTDNDRTNNLKQNDDSDNSGGGGNGGQRKNQ